MKIKETIQEFCNLMLKNFSEITSVKVIVKVAGKKITFKKHKSTG